jgi:glycosyltransferase involved in cell wall biosynthesis
MRPSFSIVTCTRDSIATLPQTLASIRMQQGVQLQMIFVDGDSVDGTLELLRRVQAEDGRVQLLTGVRGGISRAMNAGLAAARGDVVAHLHADDHYLHPQVLARVADRLLADDSDWLFGRIVSDVGGRLAPEPFVPPRFSPAALLRGNFVPHPATFVRRAVFERFGGFREDYRLAMDYEYWLRIAPHTRVSQLDEALAAFRVHAGSASTRQAQAAFDEDMWARLEHGPLWRWPAFAGRYLVRHARRFGPA